MRQQVQLSQPQASFGSINPQEIMIEFPLFRRQIKSDSWRTDITLTCINESGASLSLHYLKANDYDQEVIVLTRGREKIDTGNLDLTRGVGEYASTPQEFAQMLALHTRLLAEATQQFVPVPEDAVQNLVQSVSAARQNGGRTPSHTPSQLRQ